MRAGQGKLHSGNKVIQLSNNTDPTDEIAFLSIFNSKDATLYIDIYAVTTDTGNFPGTKIYLYQDYPIGSQETKIFRTEDFPIAESGATHFGGSATDMILYVGTVNADPVAYVYYSVYDAGSPRSISGYVNFTGDSGAGGLQGLVPAPAAGDAAAGKYLDSDGTWTTPPDTNTTYSAFDNDNAGLVPDPGSTGTTTKYLREDGSFQVPPDTNTTYSEATGAAEGLMSIAHHDKLDGIATGAEVNVQSDWNSSSGDNQILNKPTVTAFPSTVSAGNILWKQQKVTISEAQLDAMHTTAITLIAAQGADTIIMCGDALAIIDRDASQAQTLVSDLVIGYNGTTDYNAAILYERRFMYNEGGDRTWSLKADYSGEVSSSMTGAVNVPVTATFTSSGIKAGSLDEVVIYIQYYVIDNS
jgi:hypothetical protein